MATPSFELEPKKQRKSKPLAIIGVILAVIIVVALLGVFLLRDNASYNSFSTFDEHLVIRDRTNNQTTTRTITLDYTGEWTKVNSTFWIEIPYHSTGMGTLKITNIVSNTTGFELTNVSPSLPATLPNTATIEEGNVTLRMTFSTPTIKYSGTFDFTVFYDYTS